MFLTSMLSFVVSLAPAPQAPTEVPTFTRDVAPIVFARCAPCHRPGEVAPFSLLSFADVKKRSATIREVVEDRFMPPWHPVEGFGTFRNSLRLSDSLVQTIVRWVEGGMPEGQKDELPPLPKFVEGWQLGEPDLVVQMPAGFDVPASGRDIYRNFVVPLELQDDVYVTAIEVRPSARAVLHHVLFFLDDTGEARKQ
ncbi:MAG: cytochrome c, partial [Planctomycetota bacterium]